MIRTAIRLYRASPVLVAGCTGLTLSLALWILQRELVPENLDYGFVPLSALLAAAAARISPALVLAGSGDSEGRRIWLRRFLWGVGIGALVLLAVEALFVEWLQTPGRNAAVLTGLYRSADTQCQGLTSQELAQAATLDPAVFGFCWQGRGLVGLALALSYLQLLVGLGAVIGLLAGPRTLGATGPSYLNFDLAFERLGTGSYRVTARASDGREAETKMSLNPGRLLRSTPNQDRLTRRGGPAGATAIEEPSQLGGRLYRAVFHDQVGECFALSRDSWEKDGYRGLRLRFKLEKAPGLARLPWEYLYDQRSQEFLALSRETLLVRFIARPDKARPGTVRPPIRVLVVIALPVDWTGLAAAETEWTMIQEACEPLTEKGLLALERLVTPTFEALQSRMRKRPGVHVFHFVGHGKFTASAGGSLILEDRQKKGRATGSISIASVLKDHRSLRLVVLNSCQGAESSATDALAGTAQVLALGRIPAVVAMQREVGDDSATHFAHGFYRALAEGLPIDAAVCEARKLLHQQGDPDWGTPVVYLRAADGRLLEPVEPDG